ncbi:DUF6766 family protein [Rhodococcus sp. T7]|uniref:DUF6766 family protein n=2 Tax=Rhodococcus sp. T7 TaxID=627444 RepID=UPI001F2B0261|nr:DUF6766 family protein [Rhodococcus sp. T7]
MGSTDPAEVEVVVVRHVRRWGAVYVLVVLFLGSWLAQFVTQMISFRNEQQSHGQSFSWTDYWPEFLAATFENWQSEWLQLVFQAILLMGARHWIFKVEAEDMERIERKIDRIQDHLGLPTPPPSNDGPA